MEFEINTRLGNGQLLCEKYRIQEKGGDKAKEAGEGKSRKEAGKTESSQRSRGRGE
jgi:hypothetical protein